MSKRSKILDYLARQLIQADLFDGPVFTSQQRAYSLEDLPCALLLISKERQDVHSESVPRVFRKTAEVSIQVLAEHAPGAEEELHDVFSEIEDLILGDDTLADLISRVMPNSLELSAFMQGERPILSGMLKFEVVYFESFEPKASQDESLPELNIEFALKEEQANGIFRSPPYN